MLVADATCSRQTLRPQVQHPSVERHLAKLLVQHARQRHHHWRQLLHEHPVILVTDGMEQHPHARHHQITEIVQHQHDLVVHATRNDRQPRHLHPVHHFVTLLPPTISNEELTSGIVRNTRHYMYLVTLLSQVERHIITPEHLRVEILTHEQYFLFFFHIVLRIKIIFFRSKTAFYLI